MSVPAAARPPPLPPVWLMGFGFLPVGVGGAVWGLATPQLLAALKTPEPQIAGITAIALAPGVFGFLLAPLLDWRFSRRFYAIVFLLLGAAAQFAGLLAISNLPLLSALLFISNLAITLAISAVGGWFGNLVPTEKKAALGAWFTVANFGGGGLVGAVAIQLLRRLPYAVGDAALAGAMLLAIPLYLAVRCPPADRRLASESVRSFARDVLALLRQERVLWTLLLLTAPAADFALTNILGGLGRDYATSEAMVGLIGGLGVAAAGVAGSLLVPPIQRRVDPRALYLAIGLAGAAFTVGLRYLVRSPATFGLAVLGENIFQAAAFSVANAIVLRTIGHDNPLAATQFGLLGAAGSLPLLYMQKIDGDAYGGFGLTGSLVADAAISGGACLVLTAVFLICRRRLPAI